MLSPDEEGHAHAAPHISPDGRRIAFLSSEGDGSYKRGPDYSLGIMDADGGGPREMVAGVRIGDGGNRGAEGGGSRAGEVGRGGPPPSPLLSPPSFPIFPPPLLAPLPPFLSPPSPFLPLNIPSPPFCCACHPRQLFFDPVCICFPQAVLLNEWLVFVEQLLFDVCCALLRASSSSELRHGPTCEPDSSSRLAWARLETDAIYHAMV